MSISVTINSLVSDIRYTCKSYQYLHGNCGYYYNIIINEFNDTTDKVMIITQGILFDYLENVRESNSFTRFTFSKLIAPISSSNS